MVDDMHKVSGLCYQSFFHFEEKKSHFASYGVKQYDRDAKSRRIHFPEMLCLK